MIASTSRIAREDEEQMALIEWAALQSGKYPDLKKLFHIRNGGSLKGAKEGAKFKAMGVRKGVPDLFLPVPRGVYHGLFIELKRVKGGVTTPEQIAFGDQVMGDGYRYSICCGWEQAADRLLQYLSLPYPPLRATP